MSQGCRCWVLNALGECPAWRFKHCGGEGFSLARFDKMRVSVIIAKNSLYFPGAIDNSYRYLISIVTTLHHSSLRNFLC